MLDKERIDPVAAFVRQEQPMMWFWSHRPQFLHLGLFTAAYVLGCGFAQALAIVPGTGISIWPPGGLLMATLIVAPMRSWPWWLLAGCLAEMIGQIVWFGSPLPAGLLIYAGNALEAAAGAWLITLTCGRPVRLETLREVLAFVVLGAGIAPVISATVGSATLAWFGIKSQSFAAAWPLWWIGDATGVLIVAPLALVVIQNWHGKARLSAVRWLELCILGLIFLGVAALSLSDYLPFAYLIMPPLLWAAVRFEFKGAAITLILLALITAIFAISGAGQFAGDPESQRQKQIMLQLFLATSALSALIVAAISRQHQLALLTLRQSEQRLQQMIDAVPALIWCTTPEGIPSYLNKRATDVTGVSLKDMIAPDGARSPTIIHPDDRGATEKALARSFETGAPFVERFRHRQADGRYRWVEGRAEPLRDESGAIVQWYGVSVDIDDLVTAQEALRERDRELSQIVDMVPVHIRRLTPEGNPTFFNKRLIDFFGLRDLAEFDKPGTSRLAAAIGALVHPDDAASLLETVRHSVATGEPYSMKYRMRHASGAYRWVDGRAEPLRDQSGAVVQWYAISLDIDDEMRAQEALRDREQELAQLVDMVPSHVWRLTPKGEPTFFNKRMVDYLGMDVADTDKPGMSRLEVLIETVHPDDAAGFRDALNRCLVTGDGFDLRYRLRRADGAYRWMSSRAEPMRDQTGRIVQWYGLCHDIDDQMHAEEALQRSERELQQLVDALPIHIWSWTPAGKLAYVNKRSLKDLGLSGANLEDCARVAQELVHPEDAPEVLRISANCLETGDAFMMRYRRRWKDGNYRWIEGRCEPLRDRDGTIVHWYQVSIDIDDEMRAQVALRRSERELQQLIDALPVHIWSWTPEGKLAYVSKRYLEHLGLADANFEDFARVIQGLIHPEDSSEVQRTAAKCLKTGDAFMMRYRRRSLDGGYRWVEGRSEPLRDQDGTIVRWYHVTIDIDDAVRAQEELRLAYDNLARQSQAASLAELSASIAHEVNQPLAAIVANSHACQRWLNAETPNIERAQKTVERIIRDANSAADVVGRIRALFKRSVETRSHTSFESVVAETRELLADEVLRRRIRMDVDVEKGLPLVTLDRVQIQQVLINLIRNGMDAMDQVAGDKILGMRVRRVGELVQTEIRDRGQGIAFPQRIFEPFFTTKEHGMGMGLAICRSIVESHGGRLWAEKNEPRGAAFVFTLPAEVKMAP